eukprot:437319_1
MGRNRNRVKKVKPKTEKKSLKEKGNEAFVRKDFEDALEFYAEALYQDIDEKHSIHSNRSACFIEVHKFAEALEDAEMCIKLKPEWSKGYFRKGRALELLLRFDEALRSYETGLNLNREDAALQASLDNLSKMMSEMRSTEAKMDTHANPEKDKFNIMVNWLLEGGAKFPKLYLKYYSKDFRGVHALTRIPEDEVILCVPLSHIMTSDVAKQSNIGQKIIKSNVELRSKHSYLACFLLQEKHDPNSYWKPYIDILPQEYRNMPIHFSKEELAHLTGSFSLQKIRDRIRSLYAEYENICEYVPDFKCYTYEEFVWARLVVITRIFGLVIDGTKTDGLVPMADMLNHKRPRETKWTFSDCEGGFIITTLQAMQSGDEVYDSYGRKCNSRFFVNYGFSLENNEDNEAVMTVRVPVSDPHYAMKARFLGGDADDGEFLERELQVPMSYKEKKTKELFTFLRFAHARNEEMLLFNTIASDGDDWKGSGSPMLIEDRHALSIENERKVLQSVRDAARESLAQFDTSYEEDCRLLDEHEAFSNIRNCVLMRHGEKEVLRFYETLFDRCTSFLEMDWKDLKREVSKCYESQSDPANYYIANVIVPLVKGR